jgi:hypothetical protein
MTPDYLSRLYFGNPLGETWGLSCFGEDGRLVAHNIMIPTRARIFGREERGIWPFQLATHPQARMKGLFVAMTEATNDECRKRGYTYLSGVGNQNSTPIFVKKWGYQSICPLDVKVGFGAAPPKGELAESDFVQLWDDPDAIAWRLSHSQLAPYTVRHVGGVGHVYANSGRYGIQVELGSFPSELLPDDLEPMRSANPLRMWIGKDPTRDWSRSRYFDLPERLRPSPLNLLWYDLTGENRRHDPAKVQYDLFNFDAF